MDGKNTKSHLDPELDARLRRLKADIEELREPKGEDEALSSIRRERISRGFGCTSQLQKSRSSEPDRPEEEDNPYTSLLWRMMGL